MRDNKKHIYMK